MKTESYHHGDLENALLDAALNTLAVEGLHGLSLRQLAKQIGVSHNAPYQHFPDKEALVAALAERGYRKLGEAIDHTMQMNVQADPVAQIIALSQSYVLFMAQNPAYLEVMFEAFPYAKYPSLLQMSLETFDKLVSAVAAGQAADAFREGDTRIMAGSIWAMVHGLSVIFVAQRLSPIEAAGNTPEQLTAVFIGLLCDGLRTSLP